MGADLYIRSVNDKKQAEWKPKFDAAVAKRNSLPQGSPEAEAAQKEVMEAYDAMYSEGYFRDSYNGSAVMWTLGLSWWTDVIPMLNKQGNLTPTKAKKLIAMIRKAPQKLPTKQELKDSHCAVSDEGEDSVESWHKYYTEKRERLLAFLQQAVDLKEPVYCSL